MTPKAKYENSPDSAGCAQRKDAAKNIDEAMFSILNFFPHSISFSRVSSQKTFSLRPDIQDSEEVELTAPLDHDFRNSLASRTIKSVSTLVSLALIVR